MPDNHNSTRRRSTSDLPAHRSGRPSATGPKTSDFSTRPDIQPVGLRRRPDRCRHTDASIAPAGADTVACGNDTISDLHTGEPTELIDMARLLDDDRPAQTPVDPALSDLAGAVGHELNNPLTTCVGYLRQIDDMVSDKNDAVVHMVDRLGRNLNRIHSIVAELKMLADQSGDDDPRIDLAEIVTRVHAELSNFLDADVALFVRPAFLCGDRPRLHQLVYIILVAHMLDDRANEHCSVHVTSRSIGACLEVRAPFKPRGSLRLDLLGILRRDTVAGSTPMGLAARLTRSMNGRWHETHDGCCHRLAAVLPRQRTRPD